MKTKILITVSGGVVQGVYASGPAAAELDVCLCDYDEDESSDNPNACAELDNWFEDGQTARKFLQQVELDNPNYIEVQLG